ncbi:MAG TPA: histidine phosphatase family protein [Candidatus Acidoferrales bacterium]|nr:histidine phosphatase family protein [Candidatus Acidoferrales bacterium]
MSVIFLVRHAQASFLEQDYDRLSSAGETQARLLGEYWAQRKVAWDRIFTGPRLRQRDTVKIAAECYRSAGLRFPEQVVMQEFDEYEAETVLKKSLPRLLESDYKIRELHGAFVASKDAGEQRRSFQKMFEAVIGQWVGGEISVPGVEPWQEFCARVNRGLSRIMSGAKRGERMAVFSSGGPIAVAMQRALQLSPQDTLRVVWMSRNCSYSEFIFSGDRFTLSSFNAIPHIDDPTLLTYR